MEKEMKTNTKKYYEQVNVQTLTFNDAEVLSASEPFAPDNYDDDAWSRSGGAL